MLGWQHVQLSKAQPPRQCTTAQRRVELVETKAGTSGTMLCVAVVVVWWQWWSVVGVSSSGQPGTSTRLHVLHEAQGLLASRAVD